MEAERSSGDHLSSRAEPARQSTMHVAIRRLLGDERVRFIIIGGVNTVVAYLLFVLFELALGGRYLISLLLSYLIATLIAFLLHRRFTFGVTGRENLLLDLVRFESVYVVMFLANAALLPLLVEVVGWSSLVAQALIVVATTVVSYLGHKFFSFRRTHPVGSGAVPPDEAL